MESKRKTEKELLPTEVVGKASTVPPSVPLVYDAPTKDPEEWGYEEFFKWAQSRRIASGLLGERLPRFEKLRTWWGIVVQSGVGVDRLKEAFYAYSDDDFWKEKNPPYPFLGFVSQWEKYVQQREVA